MVGLARPWSRELASCTRPPKSHEVCIPVAVNKEDGSLPEMPGDVLEAVVAKLEVLRKASKTLPVM